MEINDWAGILGLAVGVLELINSKKGVKTSIGIDALNEVIEAAEKTKSYQETLKIRGERDLKIEYEIAEKWSKVAFMTSHLDKNFSTRLNVKSKFWRNTETWNQELRAYKEISLSSVVRDAKIIKAKLI